MLLLYFLDSAVCVKTFETWNGTFSPPYRQDKPLLYRPSSDCIWKIKNTYGSPVTVHIPSFELADGDFFYIYEVHKNVENLFGQFTSFIRPPTVFVSIEEAITFKFVTTSNTKGASGFKVRFERSKFTVTNTFLCLESFNVDVDQNYGVIQSPLFKESGILSPLTSIFNIRTKCDVGYCPVTFYFDSLNMTDKDIITVSSVRYLLILFR